jgi:hypothetical protein
LQREIFSGMVGGMKTASEIIDYLGRDRIKTAVGVHDDAVRKAKSAGTLPASWYHALEVLAGHALPRDAFNFKGDQHDRPSP